MSVVGVTRRVFRKSWDGGHWAPQVRVRMRSAKQSSHCSVKENTASEREKNGLSGKKSARIKIWNIAFKN